MEDHLTGGASLDGKPVVNVVLLGLPRFRVDGREHPLPRKAFVLIAMLALSPAGSLTRAQLKAALWGTRPKAMATTNLRQLISRIVQIERALNAKVVVLEGETIRLPEALRHDLGRVSPSNEGVDQIILVFSHAS